MRPVVGASLRGAFRKFFVNPKMDPQDVTDVVSSTDSDDNTSLSSGNESFYTTLESLESYEPLGDMSGDAGDAASLGFGLGSASTEGNCKNTVITFTSTTGVSAFHCFEAWKSKYEDEHFVRYVGNHIENKTRPFKPNEARVSNNTHFGRALEHCTIEERVELVQSISRVRTFTIRCKGKNEKGLPCPSFIRSHFWHAGNCSNSKLGVVSHQYLHNHRTGRDQPDPQLAITGTARTKVRLLLTQGLSPEEVVRHLGQRTNVINRHSDSATMSEMSLSTRDVRKIRDWMQKRQTYSTIADPYRVHHIVQENMRTYGVRHYQPRLTHADRFCAVFQTDWQRETMKQWLVQIPVILMDTTHNVTRYSGIFLTTIMVIRPNSGWGCDGIRYNGIPVAWMIHENQDEEVYNKFLNAIFDGTMPKPKFAMLDEAPAELNAVEKVLAAKCFWCEWHVKHALKANITRRIRDNLQRKECWQNLMAMLHAPTLDEFQEKWNWFEANLNEESARGSFIRYFEEHYVRHKKRWAHCYQQDLPISTNNHIESFHNTLKRAFLKRRRLKVSEFITVLMLEVEAYYERRESALSISGRHRKSTAIERAAKRLKGSAASEPSVHHEDQSEGNPSTTTLVPVPAASSQPDIWSHVENLLGSVSRRYTEIQGNETATIMVIRRLQEINDVIASSSTIPDSSSNHMARRNEVVVENPGLLDFPARIGNGRTPTQELLSKKARQRIRREKSRTLAHRASQLAEEDIIHHEDNSSTTAMNSP